ncbi:MAG: molybdopterin converting factor subunit 1 [Gammaproteobacteria bacterium]|nr:molybdopterin converting factor subunit 1 [Gammaproteobacteria bacterium]
MISVKFFASLRERVGMGESSVTPHPGLTARGVWSQVCPQAAFGEDILVAVNHEYVEPDHPIENGDEVAFFPPVTGG